MASVIATEAMLVAAGASIGAVARYGAHELYSKWHVHQKRFAHPPLWGIVSVNIAASLVLGVIAGDPGTQRKKQLLVGTGFCGGMSTFSTFAIESFKLAQSRPGLALAYVLISNTGCILAAGAGFLAMQRTSAARAARALSTKT